MRVAVFLSDEAKNLCIAELRKYFLTKYGEKIAFHKMCRLYVFRYLVPERKGIQVLYFIDNEYIMVKKSRYKDLKIRQKKGILAKHTFV